MPIKDPTHTAEDGTTLEKPLTPTHLMHWRYSTLALNHQLYDLEENFAQSTCPDGSFTYLGLSGSGIYRALHYHSVNIHSHPTHYTPHSHSPSQQQSSHPINNMLIPSTLMGLLMSNHSQSETNPCDVTQVLHKHFSSLRCFLTGWDRATTPITQRLYNFNYCQWSLRQKLKMLQCPCLRIPRMYASVQPQYRCSLVTRGPMGRAWELQ